MGRSVDWPDRIKQHADGSFLSPGHGRVIFAKDNSSPRLRVYSNTSDSYMHPTMSASTSPEAPVEALLFYSPRPKPVPGPFQIIIRHPAYAKPMQLYL